MNEGVYRKGGLRGYGVSHSWPELIADAAALGLADIPSVSLIPSFCWTAFPVGCINSNVLSLLSHILFRSRPTLFASTRMADLFIRDVHPNARHQVSSGGAVPHHESGSGIVATASSIGKWYKRDHI